MQRLPDGPEYEYYGTYYGVPVAEAQGPHLLGARYAALLYNRLGETALAVSESIGDLTLFIAVETVINRRLREMAVRGEEAPTVVLPCSGSPCVEVH